MVRVCIVIPAYNEEQRIGKTLEGYASFFSEKKKNKFLDFEILVVINNTQDRTEEIVKSYSKKYKEINYLNFLQGGKGFAIIEGFKYAVEKRFELIGFVDADMATPPEAFNDLILHIKNFDGVIPNRWDKRSNIKTKQTILRRILSRGFNVIVRSLFLFSHRDTQCGAKLFKRELLINIIPKLGSSLKWSFDVDLLFYSRRAGARIKSIPTTWEDKTNSTVNLRRTPITMFLSVIRLRIIHSPFRFVVRLYRKLPENIKFH
ncbi:MAG: glycosyltransferase [Nanoarchaeota archaeon]|nr:glycosyltransferase [Nanoarchaeota archaeon]